MNTKNIFKYCISLLTLFISLNNITFGQFNINPKQKYEYYDDTLEVKISTNAYELSSIDTVKLIMNIKNVSKSNIFLFKIPHVEKRIQKNESGILTIDYGYKYVSGLISWDTMIVLKPHKNVSYVFDFSYDMLTKFGFLNLFKVYLGLGFINNMDQIEKYKSFNKDYVPCYLNNDLLTLSSLTIDAALSVKVLGGFSIRIKEK